MKARTTEKPKFLTLCRLLEMPRWQVVGLLQTMWNLTADHAPRGDIGRLSDEEIADYLGVTVQMWRLWCGVLVATRWLVRDEAGPTEAGTVERFRIVVHHWHEHCEQRARRVVERMQARFASEIVEERAHGPQWKDLYADAAGAERADKRVEHIDRDAPAEIAPPGGAAADLMRCGVERRRALELSHRCTPDRIAAVIEWTAHKRARNRAGLIVDVLSRASTASEMTEVGSVIRSIDVIRSTHNTPRC